MCQLLMVLPFFVTSCSVSGALQPSKKQVVVYVVDVIAISGEYMADLPFPDRYVYCLCACVCVSLYVHTVNTIDKSALPATHLCNLMPQMFQGYTI